MAPKRKRSEGGAKKAAAQALHLRQQIHRGLTLGKWLVVQDDPIGEGGFGFVLRVRQEDDQISPVERALKLVVSTPTSSVMTEHSRMTSLFNSGVEGIPRCYDKGKATLGEVPVEYHVTELLNESLNQRLRELKEQDILLMGGNILETLEGLHFANENRTSIFVFGDLKPSNILWNKTANRWYLVDFGTTFPPTPAGGFNGTPEFASSRSLKSGGRRIDDDLESLCYVLVWALQGGTLPWLRDPHNRLTHSQILEKRANFASNEHLKSTPFLLQLWKLAQNSIAKPEPCVKLDDYRSLRLRTAIMPMHDTSAMKASNSSTKASADVENDTSPSDSGHVEAEKVTSTATTKPTVTSTRTPTTTATATATAKQTSTTPTSTTTTRILRPRKPHQISLQTVSTKRVRKGGK